MHETSGEMARLQAIIDHTAATAGPVMRANFVHPDWTMDAAGFVAFWARPRVASISTVGASGQVHTAILEVSLQHGELMVPTFEGAVRAGDLEREPRCTIASWEDAYTAVVVHGAGRRDGGTVFVRPTRIYAMRPPASHHPRRV